MTVDEGKMSGGAEDGPPPDGMHIPIPDDHYAAVGRVSDAWADMEFEIDRLIWHLLQTNQALAACLTSQMISIHPRLQALRALVSLWELSEPILTELARLDGEMSALAEKRNRSIHDKRLIRWKTKQVVRFQVSARRKLEFGPQPENISDLDAFKATIQKLTEKFVVLSQKIKAELLESAEKQRAPLPYIIRSTDPI